MRHWMKRSLAVLLCLVMLGTLLPAFAAGAEEIEVIPTEWETEEEGLIAIIGGETAELQASKPVITTQPKTTTVAEGETAKFTVAATGGSLTYQWYYRTSSSGEWSKSTGTGYNTATLSVKAVAYREGYQYRCLVKNSAGNVYTNNAALHIQGKPAITNQPKTTTVAEGETAKFTVAATGGNLTYQWYYRTSSSGEWSKSTGTGYNTATLSVKAVAYREGYQYRCLVTNSLGSIYTNNAALHILAKPAITTQPKTTTVAEGETAKFTVAATGGNLSYQWYYRTGSSGTWTKCTGTGYNTATLSVKAVAYREGYQYRCLVTNSLGSIYTNNAALHILSIPTITTQPTNVTIKEDETAKFTVKATGATAYQWYYRTSSTDSWHQSTLSTATKATLSLTAKMSRNGYQYRCKVSNATGCVYTDAATLIVLIGLPTIVTEPVSVSVKEGSTVSFTVVAEKADSYQWYWYKESESDWVAVGTAGGKTATLTYTDVDFSWDGYLFCCKVSNSKGYVWTDDVKLTITERIKPIIKTQPTDASVKEGGSASFTVSARHAESYQWYWYKASENLWSPISTASAKTATLSYTEVPYAWNGYQFRCKVTNSAGDTWSSSAKILVTERTEPAITGWPISRTVESGCPTSFSVTAKYADGYQWYWRKNSSSDWNAISTGIYATLSYASVDESWNGYQFRCKVYNSLTELYTPVATLTVTPANVTYRALLVGEVHFSRDDIATRNQGDVNLMANMLGSVTGPAGGSYTVTSKIDLDKAGLKSAISSTFAGADANDVSLFFIATHGATGFSSGEQAGRLTLVTATGTETMTIQELADCLNAVPGKVIVILGSCGSGSSIYGTNGAVAGSEEFFDAEAFNEAAISAFAALDGSGDASPNTGELRDSKFYVLTAAAHQEWSWGSNTKDYNYFTYYLCQGVLGDKPADASGNGTVTLSELYDYVYDNAIGPYYNEDDDKYYYQHAQVYPENSSYALFK